MYVNDTGPVIGVVRWPQEGFKRKLPDDDPEVLAYLNKPEPETPLTAEELYTMLETKGTLLATDRPRPKRSNG